MKAGKAVFIVLAVLAAVGIAQATVITDNFNRAVVTGQTPSSSPNLIGTNYTITSGTNWAINASGYLTANANPSKMYENTLQTLTMGAYSFTLSADVKVVNSSTAKYGGLLFNYQSETDGYAMRYSIVSGTGTVQIINLASGSDILAAAGIPLANRQTVGMSAANFYTMRVASDEGVINYSISSVGGSALISGSITNTQFTTGYSGFYKQAGAGDIISFDNYRLEVIPEPATIGMLGMAAVGLLAYRRMKR